MLQSKIAFVEKTNLFVFRVIFIYLDLPSLKDLVSIKNYIKAVNKEYITTYNTGAKSTCSDKLWLLSCGEIWDNGYNGGNTRGYAMATEGSQYKY